MGEIGVAFGRNLDDIVDRAHDSEFKACFLLSCDLTEFAAMPDSGGTRAPPPFKNTVALLPPKRGAADAPELSEDTKKCIQILEASLGRPANPDITIEDLDSMLADYVDENENSVELVRSVRDDTD